MTIPTKTCSKCQQSKIVHDFPIDSAQCKDCRSAYYRELRKKDPLVQWAKNNKTHDQLAREKFVSARGM